MVIYSTSLKEQIKILPEDKLKVVLELSTCNCYYKYLSQKDLVFNVNKFMKQRAKLFDENFLRECGFGPKKHLELYKKDLKLIKK